MIDRVQILLAALPDEVELYVRAIYCLHNILVEEVYPTDREGELTALLQRWFYQSKERFADDAEYLFFMGKILHIAEWYFGLTDRQLALTFQRRALEKEPDNLLYEWAYRLSVSGPGDEREGYLAQHLIEKEPAVIRWLESKGFPGQYLLDHLRMGRAEYLARTAPE